MEINEMKNFWKEEERRISEKVEINKEASYKKLRSSFDKVKIRRFFQIVFWSIFTPLALVFVAFPQMNNDGTFAFYLAFTFFMVFTVASFIVYIYYYICLIKIDLTDSILKTQKEILRLETFEKKLTTTAYIIVPLIALCIFKTIGFSLINQDAILFIALIGVFAIIGYIVRVKHILPREYRSVKSFLDEIDETENV